MNTETGSRESTVHRRSSIRRLWKYEFHIGVSNRRKLRLNWKECCESTRVRRPDSGVSQLIVERKFDRNRLNQGRVHPTRCDRGTKQPTYHMKCHLTCFTSKRSKVEALFRVVARVGASHCNQHRRLKGHHGGSKEQDGESVGEGVVEEATRT